MTRNGREGEAESGMRKQRKRGENRGGGKRGKPWKELREREWWVFRERKLGIEEEEGSGEKEKWRFLYGFEKWSGGHYNRKLLVLPLFFWVKLISLYKSLYLTQLLSLLYYQLLVCYLTSVLLSNSRIRISY